MPVPRRRIAALTAVLLLAVAAPAGAQSAGDDQYQDPFAGEQPTQDAGSEPSGGGGGAGGSENSEAPEPAATPAPAPAPEPASAPAPAAAEQLPRTGAHAGLLALAGALLIAGGVALRVRVRVD
jgi:LPXTG-motif cell wall-anchored protein